MAIYNVPSFVVPLLHFEELSESSQLTKDLANQGERFNQIVGGSFAGSDIQKMRQSQEFKENMTSKEQSACRSFREVIAHFLDNNKVGNYEQQIKNLIKAWMPDVS